jgi:hypothetical protein
MACVAACADCGVRGERGMADISGELLEKDDEKKLQKLKPLNHFLEGEQVKTHNDEEQDPDVHGQGQKSG